MLLWPLPMARFQSPVDKDVVLSKVSRRLLPFLFVLALLAYLDRANLSFSASELQTDTSIGDFEYGIGSSIFFMGYISFQLPGTMMARRVGAPTWLTIIMTLWGVVAASFAALCCHASGDVLFFYILRFLLGALEAGAFPTMYYYLTLWYTADELTVVCAPQRSPPHSLPHRSHTPSCFD